MAKGQMRTNKEKKKPKSDGKKQDLPRYMRSSTVVSTAGGQSGSNKK